MEAVTLVHCSKFNFDGIKLIACLLPLQQELTLQVIHAGYKDPNNLKFESITVLGVPYPAVSVSVTHNTNGTHANSAVILPSANIHYDDAKKVNIDIVVHKSKTKTTTIFWGKLQKTLTLRTMQKYFLTLSRMCGGNMNNVIIIFILTRD